MKDSKKKEKIKETKEVDKEEKENKEEKLTFKELVIDFFKSFTIKDIIFIIVFILLFTVPLPYYIHVGGGILNVNDRIKVEDEYKEKGSFNLAYVRQRNSIIPVYLLSYLFDWERVPMSAYQIEDGESDEIIWERQKMYQQESIDSAIISAFKEAGEDIKITDESLLVLGLMEESDTDLKINDKIISIDGKKIVTEQDIEELKDQYEVGYDLEIVVERNKKEKKCHCTIYEYEGRKVLGVYLLRQYKYDTSKKVDIEFREAEGGSSGGFMMALTIYNRLTKEDLSHGKKIVGTGTIDTEGNIGEIGGIKYKLKGAVSKKADIFFALEGDNYNEAIKEKKKNNYDIEIVKVKTLRDAIEYLENIK